MNLIPLPDKIIPHSGTFNLVYNTSIVLDINQDGIDFETVKLLQKEIEKVIAITLLIKKGSDNESAHIENCISFKFSKTDNRSEAYSLSVKPKKITISASSNAGFLYGAATLIQLCRTSHGVIGCVDIKDEPSFPNRGYLLDVSRGRVPTMNSLKELVDKLALYKINQLQLYVENSLRLDGFEEIWSQTDPFLAEEILDLDRHCHMRCIELVPCVATFGHLFNILDSESFGKYSEIEPEPGKKFTWYNRMRHHTINVSNPESITFITGILDQYISLFRSNKINICCDETFDLGKGKSANLSKEITKSKMYINYVNSLAEFLQKKGKQVMIWGDVLQQDHDLIGNLNKKVICLNWWYEAGAKDELLKPFSDSKLKQYACPSVSGHSRLINAYDLSFINIKEMAELGSKYHVEGFLNTDWGDSGHVNMPALTVPCMIYGAAKGWNVKDSRDFTTINQVISLVEYDDHSKNLIGLLHELSHQDLIIFKDFEFFRDYKVYNQTYLQDGVFLHEITKTKIMAVSENQLKEAILKCEKIIEELKQNDITAHADERRDEKEFYLAARGIAIMQELALVMKRKEYDQDVSLIGTPNELAGKLEYWIMDYCRDWRVTSRESELFRIKEFVWQICTILRKYK